MEELFRGKKEMKKQEKNQQHDSAADTEQFKKQFRLKPSNSEGQINAFHGV